MQQGSVETLYQNGNSLEQIIAGFTVVARYRRDFLPASPAKKPYADAFVVPKFSTATESLLRTVFPQNGGRIVTTDSVSLSHHRMCKAAASRRQRGTRGCRGYFRPRRSTTTG